MDEAGAGKEGLPSGNNHNNYHNLNMNYFVVFLLYDNKEVKLYCWQ